jgi:hypothetical protein
VPASALDRNVLIHGNCSPQQRDAFGPFTSATTPDNSDGSYIFDNWFVLSDGNDIVDLSRVTTGLPDGAQGKYRMDVETVNKKFGLFQIAEQAAIANIIKAGAASLTFDYQITGSSIGGIRAAIFAWSGTADAPTRDIVSAWGATDTLLTPVTSWAVAGNSGLLVPTTSWQTGTVANAAIANTVTNIGVGIWSEDATATTLGDFLEITRINLVPGAQPLPIVAEDPTVEKQRIFRHYYFYSTEPLGLARTSLLLYDHNSNVLPVQMRTVPTLSNATFSVNSGSAGTVTAGTHTRRSITVHNGDNNWTPDALVSLTADVSARF